MEAKPTPGPWFTKREGFSTVYVEARISGGLLQEVAACGPTQAGSEQQEANARLIAQAPDMLRILRWLIQKHDEGQLIDGGVITEARAAIARATS